MVKHVRWSCGCPFEFARYGVAVERTNPPVLDLVPTFAGTLDHVGQVAFTHIQPLWSLLPEGDHNALDRDPPFAIEFKFVEPGFMTKHMGHGTAQVVQILGHEPTSSSRTSQDAA